MVVMQKDMTMTKYIRFTLMSAVILLIAAGSASAQTMTQVVNNRLRIITNNQPIADFGSDFITLNKPLAVQVTPTYANEATSKKYVDDQIAALKSQIALLNVQISLFNRTTATTSNTTTTTASTQSASIPNTLATGTSTSTAATTGTTTASTGTTNPASTVVANVGASVANVVTATTNVTANLGGLLGH